jgi:thiamine biosynthesis lipoprotein
MARRGDLRGRAEDRYAHDEHHDDADRHALDLHGPAIHDRRLDDEWVDRQWFELLERVVEQRHHAWEQSSARFDGILVAMLRQTTWRALGTRVDLLVLDGDLDAARTAVDSLLDEVDCTYSRFRDDSELAKVQANAGHATPVSPLLWQAITTALTVARETDGAVDPTVGHAMRVIGYDRDLAAVLAAQPDRPRDEVVIELAPIPGWQAIRLDAHGRTVRVPRRVELDLGSSGKALAADLAAGAALREGRAAGALVGLGGDIATAGSAPDDGWRILASEDSSTPADTDGEVIAIEAGALATSGTTVRRWRSADGVERHHLVDPRTGASVIGPWRTVSVAADTCVAANAAATATIVRGSDGLRWLADRHLAARLVAIDGTVTRVGGWPEPAVERALEPAPQPLGAH